MSTEANDNLKFSVDDPYSGVDVESTLWWLLAFTAVTSAGGSFRTSGPLGPNPAPDVDIDTDEVDVPTILDRSQELLINAAWNVLVENIDIALWLACLVGGPDASRCIDGRITGKQEVVFDYSVGSVHEDSTMWMEISPNPSTPIHVNMYRFARLADRFEHATTTSDWTDQACVVVEVASLVLHELFHTCIPRSKVEPGDDRGECNRTYMLQASFQWAMAQRIPCITAGDGCGSFGGDENWMCDNPTNC
ncbi:MAG: hypothetical protein H6738_20740 [Alphaproteobacteria bacterium]|nr:hypothetical protein [Alphaproteobacteria bacterium]MCB9699220.1 hypothetical protein [Alphaproteobacteria bacterium]